MPVGDGVQSVRETDDDFFDSHFAKIARRRSMSIRGRRVLEEPRLL
jgi:hypothetical protein